MPKAIFMTTMTNGTPDLPPMESEDEAQLHYTDGVLCGGYTCIGQVPVDGIPSMIVQVDSSEETLNAMDADDAYVFIEDVTEPEPSTEEVEPVGCSAILASKKPPVRRKFNRGKALAYLLKHGQAADIAHTFPGAVADAVHAIQVIHGIDAAKWQHAHG